MKGRFETLLKVARLKEDAIKREIGQIETHLQAQEERLAFIRRLAEERTRDLDESRNQPTGLSTLQLYQNFFSGMKHGPSSPPPRASAAPPSFSWTAKSSRIKKSSPSAKSRSSTKPPRISG